MNALILSRNDRLLGKAEPGETTRKAFTYLWQNQLREGPLKGSWDWLQFGLDPWESPSGRYFGATLAAIAVGGLPGTPPPESAAQVQMLRGYLKDQFASQNLHNRVWALWASTAVDGVLTTDEQKAVMDQLWAQQHADGGWSLASLGKFNRSTDKPQEVPADGYATGLILHVLQLAGVPGQDARLAKGLKWLETSQQPTGEWLATSVNKERDPTSHVGKFMTTAATAYAVLALSH